MPGTVTSGAPPLRRTLASVKILVALGRERGLYPESCLKNSGIAVSDLEDPSATTDMTQELAVIRNLQTLAGQCAGLGLAAGLRYNITTFGILGYAVLSSPSVREALVIMVRYLNQMNTCLKLRLEEDAREFCIVIDDEHAPDDVRQFLVERMVGALAMTGRAIVDAGKIRGQDGRRGRVEFRFGRPAYADDFKQIGPEDIIFSAGRNRFIGDKVILDLPLPHRDSIAQYLSLEQCERQLQSWRDSSGVSGSIRQHLGQNIRNIPDIDDIASMLAMTARTLRRRLAEEGTTYRDLVNQIRLMTATEMLRSGRPVGTVADALGFSDISSFIRAFKRWTGKTPGDLGDR